MADPKMAEAPASGKKTLIEEGTEFKGAMTSNCAVVVSGKIDGELSAPSLTVSASGAVHGKVKVGDIRSQGEIAGELDADSIELSGRVNDNTIIRTKSLEVKMTGDRGKLQVAFGDCTLEVGEEPKKTAPGAPAATATAPAPPAPAPAPPAPAAAPAPKAEAPPPPPAPPAQPQGPKTGGLGSPAKGSDKPRG